MDLIIVNLGYMDRHEVTGEHRSYFQSHLRYQSVGSAGKK